MKALKKVPGDKKGLSKLPTAVRNKMGYMKKGGKVKGMTTAQRKEEYVKERGKEVYNKAYDKAFKKDRYSGFGSRSRGYIPYKLASESDKVAKPIAEKSRKKAELNASKKFDQATKYDDLLGRSTNPDKKYKKGGKVFKPHMMYKDGKSVMAKTMKDHLRLKKQGYTHKKG